MNDIKYSEYIQSPAWERKRQQVLTFWDGKCAICYSPNNVQVHHRTYVRIGDERLMDLLPLCKDCHDLFHFRKRVGLVDIGTVIDVWLVNHPELSGGNHG